MDVEGSGVAALHPVLRSRRRDISLLMQGSSALDRKASDKR